MMKRLGVLVPLIGTLPKTKKTKFFVCGVWGLLMGLKVFGECLVGVLECFGVFLCTIKGKKVEKKVEKRPNMTRK